MTGSCEIGNQRLVTPLDFDAKHFLIFRAGDGVLLSVDGSPGKGSRLIGGGAYLSVRAQRITVFEDLELVTLTDPIRSERASRICRRSPCYRNLFRSYEGILGLQEGDVIVQLNNRGDPRG